jgi:hypothetical protein
MVAILPILRHPVTLSEPKTAGCRPRPVFIHFVASTEVLRKQVPAQV